MAEIRTEIDVQKISSARDAIKEQVEKLKSESLSLDEALKVLNGSWKSSLQNRANETKEHVENLKNQLDQRIRIFDEGEANGIIALLNESIKLYSKDNVDGGDAK